MVMPAFDRQIAETDCVNCGQCRVFCPTGAITIRTNIGEVWKALADKDTRVVAQIAPAVRLHPVQYFGDRICEQQIAAIRSCCKSIRSKSIDWQMKK